MEIDRRLQNMYYGMRRRCYDKNNISYIHYGGRGIIVCDEWLNSKTAFFYWALTHGYNSDMTIDRIDVNGNYCPENCRFLSKHDQQSNKTNNVNITINGVTHTLAEWSRISGIERTVIRYRYRAGWHEDEILRKEKNKHHDEDLFLT